MIDRRRLMLSSAGLGLMAALPAVAQTPAMSPAEARLDAMLTRWFEENVDLSPEYATNLGLDRGARAALSGQLRQAGIADAETDRVRARARWTEIQAVTEEGLSEQAKVSLAVYRFTAEGAAMKNARAMLSPVKVRRMTEKLMPYRTHSAPNVRRSVLGFIVSGRKPNHTMASGASMTI